MSNDFANFWHLFCFMFIYFFFVSDAALRQYSVV